MTAVSESQADKIEELSTKLREVNDCTEQTVDMAGGEDGLEKGLSTALEARDKTIEPLQER